MAQEVSSPTERERRLEERVRELELQVASEQVPRKPGGPIGSKLYLTWIKKTQMYLWCFLGELGQSVNLGSTQSIPWKPGSWILSQLIMCFWPSMQEARSNLEWRLTSQFRQMIRDEFQASRGFVAEINRWSRDECIWKREITAWMICGSPAMASCSIGLPFVLASYIVGIHGGYKPVATMHLANLKDHPSSRIWKLHWTCSGWYPFTWWLYLYFGSCSSGPLLTCGVK